MRVKEEVPTLQTLARDAMLLAVMDTNPERLISAVEAKLDSWTDWTNIAEAPRKALLAKVIRFILFGIQISFYEII